MDLFINDYLVTALIAWVVAQILKVVINAVVYKKYDLKRLLGDGGMPSAHSATVSSLAGSVLIHCGIESVEFAIATVLAIIVCRDAMSVRKEVEKHAILLKEMKTNCDIDLELEIGHDGLEVLAGIVLGIIVAFFVYFIGNISLL